MLGHKLAGRYRVVKELGQGGFGQAFLAEDEHLPDQYQCVVKKFHMGSQQEDATLRTAKRLFDSEAKALHRLGHHDQLPKLLAHFEDEGEYYLVEEYIEGHDLAHELIDGQPLSESTVLDILKNLLGVLAFVHSKQVIHRDIKPSNIIRRQQDNRLVLIDFGAVKQVSTQMMGSTTAKPHTVVIGTPGYMPSEQFRGSPKPSSDVYAVGMIAIQALTGLNPCLGELPEDDVTGEIRWRDRTNVSSELADILSKMVLYDFRQRYRTAGDALEALEPLINQVPSDIIETVISPSHDPSPAVPQAFEPQNLGLQEAIPLVSETSANSMPPTEVVRPSNQPQNPLTEDTEIVPAHLPIEPVTEEQTVSVVSPETEAPIASSSSRSRLSKKVRWAFGGGLLLALSGSFFAFGSPHLEALCNPLGNCTANVLAKSSYANALYKLETTQEKIPEAQSLEELQSLHTQMKSAFQELETMSSNASLSIASEAKESLSSHEKDLKSLDQKIKSEVAAEKNLTAAIADASAAFKAREDAKTITAMEENKKKWKKAIDSIGKIPKDSFIFSKAQIKKKDYTAHIKNIDKKINTILAEEEAWRQKQAAIRRQQRRNAPAASSYTPPRQSHSGSGGSSYSAPPPAQQPYSEPAPSYQEPAPAPAPASEPLWGGPSDPQAEPLW